eukprot:CAMPEP_0177759926 /NCGR_PEP_ID=MMETSP0491_2-20121128/4992_1 /TAXON_ID=63592 /ORGANISM="Tetraselmis chuii, Strain PLY429" /LENGTH=272 /DNA_ID=CAMNT_0019275787 /DNA_START=240 /DNA_END=1055 /DNA_ORIENTATION=+
MSPRDYEAFSVPLAGGIVTGQEVSSARSLDGLQRSAPAWQPRPPTQTAPSGLVRSQQLVVLQNLRIPLTPSYIGSDGGLVLDRVLGAVGMASWWATLSGRCRAQRAVGSWRSEEGSARKIIGPDNFALCGQFRWQPLRRTAVSVVATAPSLHSLPGMKGLGKRSTATTGDDVAAVAAVEPGSLRVGLKVAGERHRAAATAAFNCEFMQGEGKGAAERVASRLSVDVGSQQRYKVRGQSLHYAAALIQQQVVAGEGAQRDFRAAVAWDLRGSW